MVCKLYNGLMVRYNVIFNAYNIYFSNVWYYILSKLYYLQFYRLYFRSILINVIKTIVFSGSFNSLM